MKKKGRSECLVSIIKEYCVFDMIITVNLIPLVFGEEVSFVICINLHLELSMKLLSEP